MRGVFEDDEEDLEREKSIRDTELTLGAGMLLTLFFGLVLVCGLCFGLGYALGHHAAFSPPATASAQPATQTATSSIRKPSAVAQTASSPTGTPGSSAGQPGAAATGAPAATTAVAVPVNSGQPAAGANTPGAGANTPGAGAAGQPQVRPAFPAMTGAPAPMAPVPNAQSVRPAGMQAQGNFWVQIAAVSHVEDAEVLTNALRRRGYTVTPRREPADNLIHVRVGPFVTQAEAANWRMKLLNDGYNAIIQP